MVSQCFHKLKRTVFIILGVKCVCHETVGTLQCKVLCVVSSFGHTIRHFGCELVKCDPGESEWEAKVQKTKDGCLKEWNNHEGHTG